MEKLHIAACDDEPVILGAFVHIIEECFSYHNVPVQVKRFRYPVQLIKSMESDHYDLIFLDIDMPRINGIKLAKKLREAGSSVDIIFVSNKDEMVFKVFDVRPYTFIRKSRFFEEIGGVISSYVENRSDDVKRLVISTRGDVVTLNLAKVIYFEGAGKVQHAYLSDGKALMEIKSTMQELEEKLANKGFIRVHRGFLVNYQFIESIKDSAVILTTGYSIPLSRRTSHEVKDRFLSLMKGDNSTFC